MNDFLSRIKTDDVPLQLALAAHQGTSFVPEKRAQQRQQDYVTHMTDVYERLSRFATNEEKKSMLGSEMERYRQNWLAKYKEYLSANSRIVSTMIAGPANFPVSQMEKRNDSAHKRLDELLTLQTKAFDAIWRKLTPELQPIKSADSDALQRLREQLVQAESLQEYMKNINAAHKRFLKDPASLEHSQFSEADRQMIRGYKPTYSWVPHPFPPYRLSNHNAEIRRIKQRIKDVGAMQASEHKEKAYSGVTVIENPEIGRIQLRFPGKPERQTIDLLKRMGFRWSPTQGVWQRHLNNAGRYAAESVIRHIDQRADGQSIQ